jgi:hypothetical protein
VQQAAVSLIAHHVPTLERLGHMSAIVLASHSTVQVSNIPDWAGPDMVHYSDSVAVLQGIKNIS